jgi:hypothetical protein
MYNQETYDAECAALARALETAARRQMALERVTIFTDAQAAIKRTASEEPGPGQRYAIQARKHIAAQRRARPGIVIESQHKGVPGNEKADEGPSLQWTSRTHMEWNGYGIPIGPEHDRCHSLDTSSERSPRRSGLKPAR